VSYVNIASPWKDPEAGAAGDIIAGHLVPGYLPSRLTYRFGATDNAQMSADLIGGEFYYGGFAPVEEYAQGDGAQTAFVTSDPTVHYRVGGAAGAVFRDVFGVIVGKRRMIEGVDYTVAGGNGAPATITFAVAPAATDLVRFSYFTSAAKTYPQTVHADTLIKPGAVRGRNIKVYLGAGVARARVAGIQTVDLEATLDTSADYELGSEGQVGRTINGTDCNGTLTVRAKDAAAFIALLAKVTAVPQNEVFGYFNNNSIPLTIQVENPKAGGVLKTIVVDNAQFQPPGTPARVNQPTDFAIRFGSLDGTFREVKGAFAP
jgi:hypothetical protein